MSFLGAAAVVYNKSLVTNETMSNQRLKDIFIRALRLRCPACGGGRLYRSLLDMHKACSECGMVFEREQGYFVGAVYVNVIVTLLLIVSIYMITMIAGLDYD